MVKSFSVAPLSDGLGKKAILLQGPVGPFFGRLQEHLDSIGWNTVRILFNSGDRAFRGKGRDISFTERPDAWPKWFGGFVRNFKPDVVLMLGDQRTLHQQAKQIADELGVPVISFEEGYLRPDYITMELGGNNAKSPMRTQALVAGYGPDLLAERKMPSNGFGPMARMAMRYFIALRLGLLGYPHYQHHRHRPLAREVFLWTRNAVRKRWFRFYNLNKIHSIVDVLDNQYYVVALQVHDDLQLTCHSDGWTLQRLIETAIATFAKTGAAEHHLVFKGHPLDRGHASTREFVAKMSATYNMSDRVHYVDDGSLGLLTRHSRGMLTINSTSAMVSFGHGKPVFAFGPSVYERITANKTNRTVAALERFWRVTPVLDHATWEIFRGNLIAESMVNGSYYIEEEIDETCRKVADRILVLLERFRAARGTETTAALQKDGAKSADVIALRTANK